ncbi:hypothetical protein DFQ14_101552 [Halopolyspora algeriensis]|uniref:Uncharacterized protein n=2 Tax=Halopolyspora algeriensis TaxID=1500506 RepID=A0A368VYC8_9ACTN|nr:hypothetical protein DFQ14_101552 [Halopolyspora algeriensis]TQM48292.1 hypothetical protein FHU43_3258 [Halopolyspora algeriensis]
MRHSVPTAALLALLAGSGVAGTVTLMTRVVPSMSEDSAVSSTEFPRHSTETSLAVPRGPLPQVSPTSPGRPPVAAPSTPTSVPAPPPASSDDRSAPAGITAPMPTEDSGSTETDEDPGSIVEGNPGDSSTREQAGKERLGGAKPDDSSTKKPTPPTEGGQPPAEGEEPPAEDQEPPAEDQEPPAEDQESPAEGEEPPAEGEEPPDEDDTTPPPSSEPDALLRLRLLGLEVEL